MPYHSHVDGAAEFGDQWLETTAPRRFRALDAAHASQDIVIDRLGVSEKAGRVGRPAVRQINQIEPDLPINYTLTQLGSGLGLSIHSGKTPVHHFSIRLNGNDKLAGPSG